MSRKVVVALVCIVILIGLVFIIKHFSDSQKLDNKTIAIAVLGEPATLDPNYATGVWENKIINDLFTGLVERAPDGTYQPGIAETWEISRSGLVYTFHLRDSKWSDGVPVTAQDFEYGIKRILNPQTAAAYASLPYIIRGAQAYSEGKGSVDNVGIKALDDKTLQITLEYPAAYFMEMLTHYAFFPLPKHVVEKYGKEWSKPGHMVNNGAYQLVEWKPQSFVKAKKNPYFWDAKNTNIENVIYYTQEDRSAILKRYRAKEIDIVTDFSSDQYEWLMQNMKDQVESAPYLNIYYYSINITGSKNPALKDKRVRTALAMLIDREFITDKVLKSGEIPAYSFIPSGISGYKPSQVDWVKLDKKARVAKAKELLKATGYDANHPLSLEIAYNTAENHKKIAIAIANMWQSAGIKTTSYNTEVAVHYKNMQSLDYQIGRAGWVADYPEPSAFLYVGESGVGNNYAKFSNKKYDDYMKIAKSSSSKSLRYKYYQQAEAILLDEMPYIPLYYEVSKNIVSPRIEGWQNNTADIHLTRFFKIS